MTPVNRPYPLVPLTLRFSVFLSYRLFFVFQNVASESFQIPFTPHHLSPEFSREVPGDTPLP